MRSQTTISELSQKNIDTIAQIEQAMRDERTATDRVADAIASFCGSMTFVWVHCGMVRTLGGLNMDLQPDHEAAVLQEATQPGKLVKQIDKSLDSVP